MVCVWGKSLLKNSISQLLATQEAEMGRISSQAKSSQHCISTNKIWVVCACHASCMGRINRIVTQACLGINVRPCSKSN
jgi:hypothetical protein